MFYTEKRHHVSRLVQAETSHTEELSGPLQFFIEVATYHAMTGKTPSDDQLVTKSFQGSPIIGVT